MPARHRTQSEHELFELFRAMTGDLTPCDATIVALINQQRRTRPTAPRAYLERQSADGATAS
jgi:hypothetical protein